MAQKTSSAVTIAATKAHRQFGDLIRRVFAGKEHFIVEKDGLPVMVMLSVSEYEELMQQRKQDEEDRNARLRFFHEAARTIGEDVEKTGLTEEEMMDLLEESKHKVYEKFYGGNRT